LKPTHPLSVRPLHFGGAAERSASRRPHRFRFGGGIEGAAAWIPGVSTSVDVPEPGTASLYGLLQRHLGGHVETSCSEAPLHARFGERAEKGFEGLGLLCSPNREGLFRRHFGVIEGDGRTPRRPHARHFGGLCETRAPATACRVIRFGGTTTRLTHPRWILPRRFGGRVETDAPAQASDVLTSVRAQEPWQPVFWITASVVARLMSTASVS
jgi:hypothetical protein